MHIVIAIAITVASAVIAVVIVAAICYSAPKSD